jgi:hypothetical protein
VFELKKLRLKVFFQVSGVAKRVKGVENPIVPGGKLPIGESSLEFGPRH